jgi:hypothetical protein
MQGLLLSVGNHVTVLQLVRGPTSARLRSALGRWNPVEQTGLCIYSCFRTYRLELFNRVLPNQQTTPDKEPSMNAVKLAIRPIVELSDINMSIF